MKSQLPTLTKTVISQIPTRQIKKNCDKSRRYCNWSSHKRNENDDPIKSGKVEFYNNEKGYGFIKEDITNDKYFVHVSSLNGDICEGDKVFFELEKGPKGLNAVRVNKI